MTYEIYKIIHVIGLILLFLSLGGMVLHVMNGGTKVSNGSRLFTAITHGLAMFIVLLGGFGLMARKGIPHLGPYPVWIYVKVSVWLVLGFLPVLIWRMPRFARVLWFAVPILGAVAVYFAILKPFS
jgi:hypothetical protein